MKINKYVFVLIGIVLMIIPFQAASATHNPADELFALDFESNTFYILDSTGLPTPDFDSITLPGRTIVAGMGLAVDPTTGKFYASLQVDDAGSPERVLAELGLDFTGGTFSIIANEIGTISDGTDDLAIDTLEFDSVGTLYGAVDGADYGEGLGQFSIYTINTNTALTTDVCFEHTDGDIIGPISFTDDDELLYRIYSQDSADSFFETVDIGMTVPGFFNCDSTEIVDKLVDGETFHSLTFTGAEFFGATDAGEVYSFDEFGTITGGSSPGIIYGGLASFTASANQPPIANDDEYTLNNGGKLVVNSVEGVLSNDEDADGDELTAILEDDVSNGNLILNSDGSFTYKPDPTFVGTDTFTYVAFDGLEESNVGTVQINVTFCGRDNFENVILGTKKNDHLEGTNLNDVIRGFAGNDKIDGKDGDDCIFGGKGNDKIKGGDGNDSLFGRAGNDNISGGDGNDIIKGGKGNDKIKGGDGNDEIFGGKGKDKIKGGDGDDTIKGGQGKDVIKGGDGNDNLFGNKGNDKLFGEKGNDHLNGGKGKDHCVGGKGENTFENCEKIKDDDDKKGHDKHDDKKGHDKHDDKKGHDKHDDKKGHDDSKDYS